MARKQQLKHYLVTIPLGSEDFHGYVMTDDHRQVLAAVDQMVDVLEKHGMQLLMPIVLETTLGTGADIVREVIARHMPEAKETMAKAKGYHFTAFVMRKHDNPDNDRLMELH